jgi:hypothetical protein
MGTMMQQIGETIDTALGGKWPTDFQRVTDRRWVSASNAHLRYLLEFREMKGAKHSARWGVSVDFVPHLKGKKLSWKRTAEKASLDLCIDPIDVSGSIPDWCSFQESDRPSRIRQVALASLDAAKADWSSLKSLSDIAECFESRSRMQFQRFSLQNYVQSDLAWGLVHVALGNLQQGERHLHSFCENFDVAPDDPVLMKARTEAASVRGQ